MRALRAGSGAAGAASVAAGVGVAGGWGRAAFVALGALSAMLAFFSSAALVPLAVHVWGLAETMLLLWVGWTLGGAVAYAVGRFAGRPVVRRIAAAGTLERYEGWVSRRSAFGLVLLFQLALPSEIPGYVLGVVRYRFGRFLVALAIAEAPFVVATALVGAGLVERRLPLLLGAGGLALALSAGALLLLRRRVRRATRTDPYTGLGAGPTVGGASARQDGDVGRP